VVVLGEDDKLLVGNTVAAPEAPRQRTIAKIFAWVSTTSDEEEDLKGASAEGVAL
jgi:hypothetical protein